MHIIESLVDSLSREGFHCAGATRRVLTDARHNARPLDVAPGYDDVR